eukprot:snap_masked-scaffold_9-processed-gene-5.28-mRNA-1 protein AED:1.00 eAED:1.00 QI:0/-1/0/0/-1/1/1/0/64
MVKILIVHLLLTSSQIQNCLTRFPDNSIEHARYEVVFNPELRKYGDDLTKDEFTLIETHGLFET